MKPIEIRIEGYKIVISEDEKITVNDHAVPLEDHKDDNVVKTYPSWPPKTPDNEWWQYPYVTYTNADNITVPYTTGGVINMTSTASDFHPVRDAMVNGTDCKDGTCKIDFDKYKSNSGELVGGEK